MIVFLHWRTRIVTVSASHESKAIERGTGRRVRAVGKPLAGKTGTTNGEKDTWFIGFSPDLAVYLRGAASRLWRLG